MRQTDFTIVNQVTFLPEMAVVLVGAALDGPSNIPFSLNSDIAPYDALGQCSLADAYVAAQEAGASTIIAYRLNGIHSTAQLVDKNDKLIMEFRSVSAADKYNEIQMKVFPTYLYVVDTDGIARSYFFDKYPKTVDLAYAINRDSFYGLIEFQAIAIDEYYSLNGVVDVETDVSFKGGDDEANFISSRDPLSTTPTSDVVIAPALKERLQIALFGENPDNIEDRQPESQLGAMHFGVITLCDMYHDDIELDEQGEEQNLELTEMLGSFCLNKTKSIGYGCIGVIGTKPIFTNVIDSGDTEYGDMAEVEDFDVTVHNRVLNLIDLSESLLDLEAYKYVQVIIGHTKYAKSKESSISLAYGYAATQAQIPYHTMMSNKGIGGVGKLNFEISKEDVALLSSNGYTCIVPSIRRGFVPFYASSFSKDRDSLASKPHNLRISQYVSSTLVEEIDGFVGESYASLSIKGAIAKAKDILGDLVFRKVIKSYSVDFQLLENNTSLQINASLTPFSEIKSISSIATISFPQGGLA